MNRFESPIPDVNLPRPGETIKEFALLAGSFAVAALFVKFGGDISSSMHDTIIGIKEVVFGQNTNP